MRADFERYLDYETGKLYNDCMAVGKVIFMDSASDNVFVNQGIEWALAESLREGEAALYLWSNDRTVVIGRNQDAFTECRVDALESSGGLLARRLSGGGAVWHDSGNLNFTFVLREPDFDKELDFAVLSDALAKLGIHAERSGRNDLEAGGAKFSGNAYYRRDGVMLHHGTLLLFTSPDEVERFLTPPEVKFSGKGVKSVRSRVAPLSAVKPDITKEEVAAALRESFRQAFPGAVAEVRQPLSLGAEQVMKWTAFFASDEWRYGRKAERNARVTTELFGRPAEFSAEVVSGVLSSVKVNSDSLHSDKVRAVVAALEGACADGVAADFADGLTLDEEERAEAKAEAERIAKMFLEGEDV